MGLIFGNNPPAKKLAMGEYKNEVERDDLLQEVINAAVQSTLKVACELILVSVCDRNSSNEKKALQIQVPDGCNINVFPEWENNRLVSLTLAPNHTRVTQKCKKEIHAIPSTLLTKAYFDKSVPIASLNRAQKVFSLLVGHNVVKKY